MTAKRIIHIITGLSTGGAEMMLYRLLVSSDKSKFDPIVISLTDIGPIGEKIKSLRIPVVSLDMHKGKFNPYYLAKLVFLVGKYSPNIIQTWMYHADLLGGLAGFLLNVPVVWGIHNSTLLPGASKRTTIWTAKINAKLSYVLPKRIVSCSNKAYWGHIDEGFSESKMCVIPNGFDITVFCVNSIARDYIRSELEISDNEFLIGMIARFDPQKDHGNFVESAKILTKVFPNCRFLLCGDNIDWNNKELSQMIYSNGLEKHFYLLGRREDVNAIQASLDIATLSSFGEAFPLVIGEAMACGIPCVATDVGDSAYLVGSSGIVVPPKNPQALANAWQTILEKGKDERIALGNAARKRIEEHFSIQKITAMYESLYMDIVGEKVCT